MKNNRVIEFEPNGRILEKARKYIDSVEDFLDDRNEAIPLLLKALKLANRDFKHEIVLVLSSFAKQEIVWPLHDMMTDPLETEEIRHDAAIHLSVVGQFIKDPRSD
jgi:hypothetical protein